MWNKVHFSSASDNWSTPQEVFDWADAKFGPLLLDVCADSSNAKCPRFICKEQDGLTAIWNSATCWMNPPYGRGIGEWVKRAWGHDGLTVCLLPARTDTRWFHDYCVGAAIYFLRGRLKFGGAKNSAPFPSMIVVFGRTSTILNNNGDQGEVG